MKKLIITAAIVCAAIASQAALVNWKSSTAPYFLDTSALAGNGSYTAETTKMKGSGYTFQYVLAVTSVDEVNGTVAFNSFNGAFLNNGISLDGSLSTGTTYNYTITLTTSLSGLGTQGSWDYSSAVATTTLSGTFTGSTGTSNLTSGIPSSWTVSGAQAIPEPTSGLLLLLGMAGLALKRKRA